MGKPQPCTQGSGFALVSKGLRGRFFPTCQPYGWAFLFLASLFASPPYGTQRVDFAVLWGAGFTPEPRQVVVSFHCSHISFALPDPIQGHIATSLRTDDLF